MTAGSPERVASFDGTQLATRRYGEGSEGWLLAVNAIGTTDIAWRGVLPELVREGWGVLTWDHRGLHDSGPAVSSRLDARAQAQDALAVLDAAGIERASVLTWSTGAPIALELVATEPSRFPSLVAACPSYGRRLRTIARHLEVGNLLPLGAAAGRHLSAWLATPFKALVRRPEIAGLVRQSGFIAATADVDALVVLLQGLASVDMRALLDVYAAVMEPPTPERLQEVEARCLFIAGERDPFAPLSAVGQLAAQVPLGEVEVYPRSTHYLPLEHPQRLAADVLAWARATPSA